MSQKDILGGQGESVKDPISPYIFVLCMEILSRKLKGMSDNPSFRFHPKCKAMRLVHLAFADDLLIFCKGDLRSVRLVKECLDDFCAASGLSANSDKSQCFIAGTISERTNAILSIMEFSMGELPVQYLGCPLHSKRIVVVEYAPLITKIQKLIQGWETRKMSYAGQMQLIKSVLGGLLGFWSQMFLFPLGVIHKIESLCKRFLWNGNDTGRKFMVA